MMTDASARSSRTPIPIWTRPANIEDNGCIHVFMLPDLADAATQGGQFEFRRHPEHLCTSMSGQLLKPEDVRQLLNVSRSWLYAAANDGRIPCFRLGGPAGPLRFERSAIEEWLANSGNGVTPQPR
jgi:excisionase family DNA binding protein